MINQLEKEVKELTIEDEKLTKAIEELEKAENQLLEGYTVKHYEYELENWQRI
jgi:phosphoribosylformylglycinamidine (FGAM) synthase PurS component